MRVKFSTNFDAKRQGSESRQANTYKEAYRRFNKVKSWEKLKHTFNAIPDLQTKFFSQTMRHLVISTKFR